MSKPRQPSRRFLDSRSPHGARGSGRFVFRCLGPICSLLMLYNTPQPANAGFLSIRVNSDSPAGGVTVGGGGIYSSVEALDLSQPVFQSAGSVPVNNSINYYLATDGVDYAGGVFGAVYPQFAYLGITDNSFLSVTTADSVAPALHQMIIGATTGIWYSPTVDGDGRYVTDMFRTSALFDIDGYLAPQDTYAHFYFDVQLEVNTGNSHHYAAAHLRTERWVSNPGEFRFRFEDFKDYVPLTGNYDEWYFSILAVVEIKSGAGGGTSWIRMDPGAGISTNPDQVYPWTAVAVAAPEPSSCALLGCSGLGLLLFRRPRRTSRVRKQACSARSSWLARSSDSVRIEVP